MRFYDWLVEEVDLEKLIMVVTTIPIIILVGVLWYTGHLPLKEDIGITIFVISQIIIVYFVGWITYKVDSLAIEKKQCRKCPRRKKHES